MTNSVYNIYYFIYLHIFISFLFLTYINCPPKRKLFVEQVSGKIVEMFKKYSTWQTR